MKRKYVAPQCEVIALEFEGIIATSQPGKHDEYSEKPSLAPRRDTGWSSEGWADDSEE